MPIRNMTGSMIKIVYKIQLIRDLIKTRQESAPFRRYLPKCVVEGFSAN